MKTLKLILVLTLFTTIIKAQTFTNACYVASTGRIWENTGGCGYYITVCDGSDIEYATITSGLGATCNPCGISPNGRRVTIEVTSCSLPIDNYVWLLVIASSLVLYKKRGEFFA